MTAEYWVSPERYSNTVEFVWDRIRKLVATRQPKTRVPQVKESRIIN